VPVLAEWLQDMRTALSQVRTRHTWALSVLNFVSTSVRDIRGWLRNAALGFICGPTHVASHRAFKREFILVLIRAAAFH